MAISRSGFRQPWRLAALALVNNSRGRDALCLFFIFPSYHLVVVTHPHSAMPLYIFDGFISSYFILVHAILISH